MRMIFTWASTSTHTATLPQDVRADLCSLSASCHTFGRVENVKYTAYVAYIKPVKVPSMTSVLPCHVLSSMPSFGGAEPLLPRF